MAVERARFIVEKRAQMYRLLGTAAAPDEAWRLATDRDGQSALGAFGAG